MRIRRQFSAAVNVPGKQWCSHSFQLHQVVSQIWLWPSRKIAGERWWDGVSFDLLWYFLPNYVRGRSGRSSIWSQQLFLGPALSLTTLRASSHAEHFLIFLEEAFFGWRVRRLIPSDYRRRNHPPPALLVAYCTNGHDPRLLYAPATDLCMFTCYWPIDMCWSREDRTRSRWVTEWLPEFLLLYSQAPLLSFYAMLFFLVISGILSLSSVFCACGDSCSRSPVAMKTMMMMKLVCSGFDEVPSAICKVVSFTDDSVFFSSSLIYLFARQSRKR